MISILALSSCHKDANEIEITNEDAACDNNIKNSNFNVDVKENTLVFPTINDYEKAIKYLSSIGDDNFSEWEESLGYTSFRGVHLIDDSTFICDELLGALLNPDGYIVIGKYRFRVNSATEKVEVYDYHSTLKSTRIVNEHSPNSSLVERYFYDGNEDTGDEIEKASFKSGFVGNDKEGYHYFSGSHGSKVKSKVVYQSAGIYFSLQSKIKYENKLGCGGTTQIGLIVEPNCYYTRRRGLFSNKTSTHNIPEKSEGGYCGEYNYRAYEDVYRLTKYMFSVRFYYNDAHTGESGEGILTISR